MSDQPDPSAPGDTTAAHGALDVPPLTVVQVGVPEAVREAGSLPAIPGYELHGEIGSGGMGVVYAARDLALNRSVAVKLLRQSFPVGGSAVQRFLDEAQITGQLQHPGIPPVHQVGTLADGRPYLIMKLIKGRTLHALLAERRTPADDRARFVTVFEKVCLAVGYAHRRSTVHRDLKPANIMVGAFGEVQVMDWGLAKVIGVTADLRPDAPAPGTTIRSVRELGTQTQAGSVLGSPAFMPPEQAGGEVARIDPRTDVFGLGAVLCAVLTGHPPYTGADVNELHLKAIRGQTADAFARLDTCGADPELIALAKRCLATDPAERPADGAEVAAVVASVRTDAEQRVREAELDRARAEGELLAARATAAEYRKRRRVQFVLLATVVLLGFAGGAFAWWEDRRSIEKRADDEHRRTEQESQRATTLQQNTEAIEFLLGVCETLLRNEDVNRATAVLRVLEILCREGVPAHLVGRRTQCESDAATLALLVQFEATHDLGWNTSPLERNQLSESLRAIFVRSDFSFGIHQPAEIARRIEGSTIRSYIVYMCDHWEAAADPPELREVKRALGVKWITYLAESPTRERKSLLALARKEFSPSRGRPDASEPVTAPPPREVKQP